jgi:hypothetical protein
MESQPHEEPSPKAPPPDVNDGPTVQNDEGDNDYEPSNYDDGDDYEPGDDEQKTKNSVFAEGLGAGIFYSLNYERIFFDQLGLRIGAGFVSVTATAGGSSSSSSVLAVPIMLNYVGLYKGWHGLDVGAGTTILVFSGAASVPGASGSASGAVPVGVGSLGYRLHPIGGDPGFQLRLGADIIVATDARGTWAAQPWGHLSLGVAF